MTISCCSAAFFGGGTVEKSEIGYFFRREASGKKLEEFTQQRSKLSNGPKNFIACSTYNLTTDYFALKIRCIDRAYYYYI
jgi:hypothetical protein